MLSIAPTRPLCTVIVTVDAPSTTMEELADHARRRMTAFAEYPGFLGGATHLREDGGRLVQYVQWQPESHHLACRGDPRWEERESTRRFLETVRSGQATLDVRSCDVLAVAPGAPRAEP